MTTTDTLGHILKETKGYIKTSEDLLRYIEQSESESFKIDLIDYYVEKLPSEAKGPLFDIYNRELQLAIGYNKDMVKDLNAQRTQLCEKDRHIDELVDLLKTIIDNEDTHMLNSLFVKASLLVKKHK